MHETWVGGQCRGCRQVRANWITNVRRIRFQPVECASGTIYQGKRPLSDP